MQQQILNRIAELGGDISQTTGDSLIDDLQKITFKEVLHFKRFDEEPFYNFYEDFYKVYWYIFEDTKQFIDEAITQYYVPIDNKATVKQAFWINQLYTPFTANTPDYDNSFDEAYFLQYSKVKVISGKTLEFLFFIVSDDYPDRFFICTNDINPDNPTVFSTDQEVYLDEINNEGSLLDFLNRLMTKQEARASIQVFLDNIVNKENYLL